MDGLEAWELNIVVITKGDSLLPQVEIYGA